MKRSNPAKKETVGEWFQFLLQSGLSRALPMLGPKAVWELCQASLMAKHHPPKKPSVGSSWEGRWKSHSQGLGEQHFGEKKDRLT